MPQQHLKGPETKARVTGQLFPQCLSDYGRSLASHLLIQTIFTKCLLCASEYREPSGLCVQALGRRLWAGGPIKSASSLQEPLVSSSLKQE